MSDKALKINKDYLLADNTKCLKGILAVCIVLHHLYSATSVLKEILIGKLFMFMGYWCVSVFFFITGYGLMTQYKKYRVQYIKHFFRNRIVSFYTICLIGVLLYCLYDACIGISLQKIQILTSLTFGGTIIANGWYLQTVLIVYILFWGIFKLDIKDNYKISLMFFACLIYIALCILFNMEPHWYQTVLSVILGMVWSQFKDKIDLKIAKKYVFVFIACCGVFVVSGFVYKWFQVKTDIPAISLFSKTVYVLCFTVLVIMLLMKLPIQCGITKALGEISLEVYMIHGVMINAVHRVISNEIIYIFAVILCTIISAILFHQITKRVMKLIKTS